MRLTAMAKRATASIDRITSFPVVLITRALSATGITKATIRAAAKAIRKDRVILASTILMSPLLTFFGIFVVLGVIGACKAVTTGDTVIQALRSLVLLLTALSVLGLHASKAARKHRHGLALRERIKSERLGR